MGISCKQVPTQVKSAAASGCPGLEEECHLIISPDVAAVSLRGSAWQPGWMSQLPTSPSWGLAGPDRPVSTQQAPLETSQPGLIQGYLPLPPTWFTRKGIKLGERWVVLGNLQMLVREACLAAQVPGSGLPGKWKECITHRQDSSADSSWEWELLPSSPVIPHRSGTGDRDTCV